MDWRDATPADFAVIGDPIEHSWSPKMMAAAFASLGLALTYRAVRVAAGEFDVAVEHLRGLGYRGLNVTVPHKETAHAWARDIDERSRRLGALNTLDVVAGRGTNTDAPGFLDVLARFAPSGARALLLLGAGGTARALAPVLLEAGWSVRIANRTRSRAEALAQATYGLVVLDDADPAGCGVVVDATSAGLSGTELPVRWDRAEPGSLAIDLVYGRETPFRSSARAAGLQVIDGRELLVSQGLLSLSWWLGSIDREIARAAMRRAVGLD